MSFHKNLSKQTSFFGIRLWIIIAVLILLFTVLVVFVIFISIFYLCRQRKSKSYKSHFLIPNPISYTNNTRNCYSPSSLDRRLLSQRIEIEMNMSKLSGAISNYSSDYKSAGKYSTVVSDAWRGNKFSYTDLDMVTNGFSDDNLIGFGEHGSVYRGVLLDARRVAIKNLSSYCCQDEEFVAEIEAIGHVRHKNIVTLLGYCTDGGYRMIVNEYLDNGNLHQWLHGCTEQVSPLTWSIRMHIIQAVAKGLAYLHDDIEPKIVHQNLKSTNILLDHQWNPKISDFGIVKLCGSEGARAMETSGYLSREFAFNGVLNERTDVYSFGILVMEIVTGRTPVDHNQPQVYLIDWLKSMVMNQKIMYVADPKLPELPSVKELKRIILLALRCVDPKTKHRPTMGDVIRMLQPRDLLLNDEHESRRNPPFHQSRSLESQIVATNDMENSSNVYRKMLSK